METKEGNTRDCAHEIQNINHTKQLKRTITHTGN